MKIYAIIDKDVSSDAPIGFLYCYEKAEAFIMELQDDLDEWEAPLLFQSFVREGKYTIPSNMTILWVRERLIPNDRQNIGVVLKNAGLKAYSESAILGLTKGKCAQDNCFLREISYEDVPENIKRRADHNITECFPAEHAKLICMFRDHTVRRIDLKKLHGRAEGIEHILKNENLFQSVKVGVGGYSISFDNTYEIPVEMLREPCCAQEVAAEDMSTYAQKNLVDTTKACELMKCSRQNIAYLVNTGKLIPVINGTKEKLFTRGDIERVLTE